MSFPADNIGFWMARRAQLTPDRPALIIDGERTWTFAELDARAARAAGTLAALGVAEGDRVATYLAQGPEYIEVFLACARLGAIVVPLSTRLAAPELEFLANDAECATLVSDASLADTVAQFLSSTAVKQHLVVGEGYEEALAATEPRAPVAASPDDVLAIFYTSGTTGRQKGAMLTHANFFWTNLNMHLAFDFTQDERSLMVLPLFHVGGWNVNTLSVWWKGGAVVLERAFDPARALRIIGEQRVTSMMGVPTIYQMLADHPDFASADLSSVRAFICGGAPLPVSLIERYQERGVAFIQGYGLTEAAPNCLILPPEHAIDKAGAAGRPYFYTDVRVVDQGGRPARPGVTGEVIVRGPSVMKGYWNLPEETASALREGWLHTGDAGQIDDDGFITIVDRVKDMYISGGENVYPAEVERILHAHPAVAEAAVIGVPDDRWGEVGRAIVVLRDGMEATAEDLQAHCRERLAKFKVPADVVFTDSLPRNPTGKLLKPQLRKEFGS